MRAYPAQHVTNQGSREEELYLVPEETLVVRVQGHPYAAVARTPGDEEELVAGMCFVDSLIEGQEDLASLTFSDDRNLAQVQLSEARYREVLPILQDKAALRHSQLVPRAGGHFPLILDDALHLVEVLSQHQELRRKTLATHGVAIFDGSLELLTVKEDLGRHNAFDKAIGDLILRSLRQEARIAVLSSRIASELVIKALRLGVSMVLSVSRPTEGALALARQGHLGLACLSRDGGFYLFT